MLKSRSKVFSFCKVLPSHLTAWVRKTRKHFKTWFLIKLTNLPCNTLINCHRKQTTFLLSYFQTRLVQGQEKIAALCDSVTCDSVTQCVSQCNIFLLIFLNIGKVVKITFFSLLLSLCVTLIVHLTKFRETPARHVQCSKDHFWISLSCGG